MKENFQIRKGGDIEEGGKNKEKEKDRRTKRQEVKWKLTAKGWHKDNFDGVAKGNLGPLGCGGIIRNCHGRGVVALSYPLGNQINHYIEASATLHTVKLALDVGVKKLWLKGDSNNIIRCIKGALHPTQTIANIIE